MSDYDRFDDAPAPRRRLLTYLLLPGLFFLLGLGAMGWLLCSTFSSWSGRSGVPGGLAWS